MPTRDRQPCRPHTGVSALLPALLTPWVLVAGLLTLTACGDTVTASGEPPVDEPEIPGDEGVLEEWQHLEAHTARAESLRSWDGTVEGMKTLWHDNGVKRGEGEYRNDLKHGPWIFWYEGGQKRWEGSFRDDVEHGEERAWYENGELYYEGRVVEGRREGVYSVYHDNGQLWWRGKYADGKKQGEFEYFNADGTPDSKLSGLYQNGKRVSS